MPRFARCWTARLLLLGAALTPAAGARAEEVEVREFATKIDGSPAGVYRMTITRHDDGSVTMDGQADVKVTKLAFPLYKYSYRGTEVWRDGRLVSLHSSTDDDGTKYKVEAAAERAGVRVKVNGDERLARPDVWLTSYWRLPDARQRNGALPLLEPDTGRLTTGALRYLGTGPVTFAGRTVECARYRIAGPRVVDVWYDGAERLVRQEWTEEGRKVLMELTAVR